MKRSGFRRKVKIGDGNGHGTSPNRSQGEFEPSKGILRAPRQPLKRSGRLKAGRKTNHWNSVRAQLKKRFAAVEITTCEAQLDGCRHDDLLGFAHRVKRRKIIDEHELETVALLCNICHDQIEGLSPLGMMDAIDRIICSREVQP